MFSSAEDAVSIPLLSVAMAVNKRPWQHGLPAVNAVADVAFNNGKVPPLSSPFSKDGISTQTTRYLTRSI